MLFSIIVPIYNVEKYLRECLESIKGQTFQDYEVIMIDDGSTDNCPEICDEYACLDKRFKAIHKKNGGLVSARKVGAEHVSGDYVLNIDSDDYVDEELLEKLYNQVKMDNPDVIAFSYKTVDEKGVFKNAIHNFIEPKLYKENIERIKRSYMYDKTIHGHNGGSLIFSIWTKLVKREIYKECQSLVDNRISKGEDTILNLLIVDKAKSMLVSKINGYNYRLQPTSMTHVFHEKDIENQKVLAESLNQIKINKPSFSEQIEMYIFYSTYMMLQKLVNRNTKYRQYKEYVKKILDARIYENLHSDFSYNARLAEKIKVFLIKNNIWSALYVYFKFSLK
jgi:hypothetical protein